jgi:hypothetical protein
MILKIQAAQYHADLCVPGMGPTLSSHLARDILLGNMHHVWLHHPRLNPKYTPLQADKFRLGRAVHSMVLEGGADIVQVDPEEYRTEPTKAEPLGKPASGWNNKSIKNRREEIESCGMIAMLPDEYAEIERMACAVYEAVATEPDLCGMRLTPEFGLPEQTIITEVEGVMVRVRPDFLSHDFLWMPDFKSTSCLCPDSFIRKQVEPMGYDFQMAYYSIAVKSETGITPDPLLIVMQDTYPYDCFFVRPSAAMMAVAEIKVRRALALWREALATDQWPGWKKGLIVADPTPWSMAEAEMMEAETPLPKLGAGANWDKNAPGSKENFLGGTVKPEINKYAR